MAKNFSREELNSAYLKLISVQNLEEDLINYCLKFFGPNGKFPILAESERSRIDVFVNMHINLKYEKENLFNDLMQSESIPFDSSSKIILSKIKEKCNKDIEQYSVKEMVERIEFITNQLSDPDYLLVRLKELFNNNYSFSPFNSNELEILEKIFLQRVNSYRKEQGLKLIALSVDKNDGNSTERNYFFENKKDYKAFVLRRFMALDYSSKSYLNLNFCDDNNTIILEGPKNRIKVIIEHEKKELTKEDFNLIARDVRKDINTFNHEEIFNEISKPGFDNLRDEIWIISQKGFDNDDLNLINKIHPNGLRIGKLSVDDEDINWLYDLSIFEDSIKINLDNVLEDNGYYYPRKILSYYNNENNYRNTLYKIKLTKEFYKLSDISQLIGCEWDKVISVRKQIGIPVKGAYTKYETRQILDYIYNEDKENLSRNRSDVITNGDIKLTKINEGEYQYVSEDLKFTVDQIANMIGFNNHDIKKAIEKLNLPISAEYSQQETKLILDYLSNPSKYNYSHKTEVVQQSKYSSSEWTLIAIGAIAIAGVAYYLTRNSSTSRLVYRGASSALSGSTYLNTGRVFVPTFASGSSLPTIISFANTKSGVVPIWRGVRGGIYKYLASGARQYI